MTIPHCDKSSLLCEDSFQAALRRCCHKKDEGYQDGPQLKVLDLNGLTVKMDW